MDKVIQERAIHFVRQPIVRSDESGVFRYDVLCRVEDPLFSHPQHMFDVAARCGRIWELERRVRAHALADVQGLDEGRLVFLNLHPSELDDPKLFEAQESRQEHASLLVFEITEQGLIADFNRFRARMDELRAFGVWFAFDDL